MEKVFFQCFDFYRNFAICNLQFAFYNSGLSGLGNIDWQTMSRLKTPQKQGSKYITPEGNKALAAAAAEGDRSENAEYIYRKKQLREIDHRIHFLKNRLEDVVVVGSKPDDETM